MSKIEEDTWMNPQHLMSLDAHPPKNGTYYVIERKKAIPVTGNVSHIYQWNTWQEFDSKEKRDAELDRLRKKTVWVLRGRTYRYINGNCVSGDPTEMMDF